MLKGALQTDVRARERFKDPLLRNMSSVNTGHRLTCINLFSADIFFLEPQFKNSFINMIRTWASIPVPQVWVSLTEPDTQVPLC